MEISERLLINWIIYLFLVSSMNRMVNQVGTAQETPEIRQQL